MHEHNPTLTAKATFVAGEGMIAGAVDAANAFSAEAELTRGDAAKLAVLVEELVANVCDHGGCERGDTIALTLSADRETVSIELDDPGVPFDPTQAAPDAAIPERGGGAGIALIRAWASEFRHFRRDGRNFTTMILSRDV